METTETETTETPAPEATSAAAAPEAETAVEKAEEPKDPSVIGKLSAEEQQLLLSMRQQQQRLLLQIGEKEHQKKQLLMQIDQIQAASQEAINSISKRLGVEDGQQWVAMANGEIRLAATDLPQQNLQQGGAASSA